MRKFVAQPLSDRTVSIIIPSARPDKVIETIDGLLAQTFATELFEILVVTPHSNNRIAERDKKARVKTVVVEELYPPGRMRNIGARSAVGHFFAFIDDDCIPEHRWLETLLEELSLHPDVGMAGCRVVSGKKGFWEQGADYSLFAAYQHTTRHDTDLGSAAIVVRRQAFVEVGGFEESLLASEDWDFSLRLRGAGWRCVFTPDVEVLHYHGRDALHLIVRNAFRSGYLSGLEVQKKHYSTMSWLAKISVRLANPLSYFFLILPYAAALSVQQGAALIRSDPKNCLHIILIFVCRLAYQFGVWKRLIRDAAKGADTAVNQ